MQPSLPMFSRCILFVGSACLIVSCASPKKQLKNVQSQPAAPEWVKVDEGKASWYGGYWHKRLTANGEHYDQNSMTAAHKKLKFGTLAKVTNERNGCSCIVRINNRGPFVKGRVIDLSVAAAKKIGSFSAGVVPVTIEVRR